MPDQPDQNLGTAPQPPVPPVTFPPAAVTQAEHTAIITRMAQIVARMEVLKADLDQIEIDIAATIKDINNPALAAFKENLIADLRKLETNRAAKRKELANLYDEYNQLDGERATLELQGKARIGVSRDVEIG